MEPFMQQYMETPSLQILIAQFARQYSFCTYGDCDEIGLHPGQIPLLKLLSKEDGKSHNELASALCVRPSTITMMIRRMEKNKFLLHKTDDKDMRVRRVYITNLGKDALLKAEKIFDKMNQQLFANFSDEELSTMQELILRLQANLQTITKE